jgi:cytidyltransferase-like protein
MAKKYHHGIVFGVFDHFHPGHEHFLREAEKLCEHLTVVVTLSETVNLIKKFLPEYSFEERVSAVRNFNESFNVIPGDKDLGTWSVLKDLSSDIIILGYDQKGIADELRKMDIDFVMLESHRPELYKSRLYRNNLKMIH